MLSKLLIKLAFPSVVMFMFFLTPEMANAQHTVSGYVTDAEDGAPMPGVNVAVRDTTIGTSTDADGEFTLTTPRADDVLVFSFIGYETREVPLEGRTELEITMVQETYTGDELVVVGYGVQRRSDFTGSVSSVTSEEFNVGESGSIQALIQGKMPGVRVVENTGRPGGGLSVSIRGASSIQGGTSPLWVVDGSPMAGGLRNINSEDIESIEVLKDASATAIYGSRASGGVVMVTTKRGGKAPLQVNYHAYSGTNFPVNNIDMLSPEEYMNVINAIIDEGGGNPEDRVESTGAETDWQGQIFNLGAMEQSHTLSFGGDINDLNYYVSLNTVAEDGSIKRTSFERYSGNINLNYSGAEKFRFGSRLKLSHVSDENVALGGVNENAGPVYTAMFFDPTLPVRNADGTFFESDELTITNPLASIEGEDRTATDNEFTGNIFGEYYFTPNFNARVNVGFNIGNSRSDVYISRLTEAGRAAGGRAVIGTSENLNHFIEGTFNYQEDFGDHNLKLLAGVETQQFNSRGASLSAENFATDGTGTNNMGLGDAETFSMNSGRSSNRLLSAFGRVNYIYKDRYLLTTTFRADGSTRFGEESKFGYFPSVAIAWQLMREDFMQDFDFINELKPRVSWGQTGNQAIGNYLSTTTFSSGGEAVWDDQPRVGLTPSRIENSEIKWETTEQWDIGLDVSLFEDRISAHFDYFQQNTYDMLMAMPLPRETGFNTQIQNVGSIRNNGFELELRTRNISTDRLLWTTNVSFATIRNEVTDLGGIEEILAGSSGFSNNFFIIREGLPLRSYYGYEIEGIWQTDDDFSVTNENVQPGDLKFRDQNGDGDITAEDRVDLGNSFPDFTFSLGNTITYRNFQLNVFFEASQGVKMLNNNLVDTYYPVQLRRNKLAEPYLNRWTEENPSDTYPSFVNPGAQGQHFINSYTVEDASYIRLKNVQLSYSFSPDLLEGVMRSAQIYVVGSNLKTWSDYTGFNPAMNPGGDPNARVDYNAYPITRSFQFGVKLGF